MSDVWIYLDESGTPDFDLGIGSSPYFAIGEAVMRDGHDQMLGDFLVACAGRDKLVNGFHAYDDSSATKAALFDVMGRSGARYAFTFMAKANAYADVRDRPKIWLYQYALYVHLKASIPVHSRIGDTVHVIAAHITMGAKQAAIEQAVSGVCGQLSSDRVVVPHMWRSPTSAGLQMADYALWATQRSIVQGRTCFQDDPVVRPRESFCHFPWGTAPRAAGPRVRGGASTTAGERPAIPEGKNTRGVLVAGLLVEV
jgi:hypothetical protein